MEQRQKFCIYVLAGHLLCIAGFEWTRAWDFFPGQFRPLVTLMLSLAFLFSLILGDMKTAERPAGVVIYCSWMGVLGFMLLKNPLLEAGAVMLLGVFLSIIVLAGSRILLGVGLSALAAGLAGMPVLGVGWGGVLFAVLAAAEWGLMRSLAEPSLPPKVADLRPRAEIFWRGFAQLYAACASGEGEKYSRQVLDHTSQVINSCGGILESGSEHRGVYLFIDPASRARCLQALKEYGQHMNQSLLAADVPEVELTFRHTQE